ncbi:HET-domain-containing protein [Hypoxylon trugodes]|uniref:HET-domain-containing protein n=1 Tax=Hypoxylon trugodes TaxID=326681 RepID=UPI002192BC1B|nr:HET-domain-containing protein [Hypoxylon trugodes]KAI1392149.1 HET-domain-containing protein [Hypoxylon trugodes]
MVATTYEYQSLKPDSHEIRVLQIHPTWRRFSTIKCSLVIVNLDELGNDSLPFSFYEALSYTWGDPTGKVEIKLDGRPFEVTRNLAAALRRLRAKRGFRFLWVDAVCINQADEQERNSQVALMGLIYRRAEQVLIWLGQEADGSRKAMKLIDSISDIGVEESDIEASLLNDAHYARWQDVVRLFDRSYWRRVWVRQEVALAKGIVVLCGDYMMSWDALIEAAVFLNEHATDFEPIVAELTRYSSGYGDAIGMDILREMILKDNEIPLEDVVLHLRQCECTDQRDKVYGALGLVGPKSHVPIDYGLDKVTIYTKAAIAAIESSGSLNIICACQDPARSSGLSSWVPNLEVDWIARKLRRTENLDSLGSAGGFAAPKFSFHCWDEGAFTLKARGVIVDVVSEICSEFDHSDTIFDVMEEWRTLAMKTLSTLRPPPSAEEMRSHFWRTITTNEELRGLEASDSFIAQAASHIVKSSSDAIPPIDLRYEPSSFNERFRADAMNRRFYATKKGYIGLGPSDAKTGDHVVVLLGSALPVILREEGDHHVLVGETYTHGIMRGEIASDLSDGSLRTVDFAIH